MTSPHSFKGSNKILKVVRVSRDLSHHSQFGLGSLSTFSSMQMAHFGGRGQGFTLFSVP